MAVSDRSLSASSFLRQRATFGGERRLAASDDAAAMPSTRRAPIVGCIPPFVSAPPIPANKSPASAFDDLFLETNCLFVAGYAMAAVECLPAYLLWFGDRADLLQEGQHIKIEP